MDANLIAIPKARRCTAGPNKRFDYLTPMGFETIRHIQRIMRIGTRIFGARRRSYSMLKQYGATVNAMMYCKIPSECYLSDNHHPSRMNEGAARGDAAVLPENVGKLGAFSISR